MRASLRSGPPGVFTMADPGVHDDRNPQYALAGIPQVAHYAKNENTKLAYLVVFDARKKEFGKGMQKVMPVDDIPVRASMIDVRPEVKN